MQIRKVTNRKELSTFINFPTSITSQIRFEYHRFGISSAAIDAKRNPLLEHCRWQLFLLENGGVRSSDGFAAFYDLLAQEFWNEKVGHFGYFECAEDEMARQDGCCSKPPALLASRGGLHFHARTLVLCLPGMGLRGGRIYPLPSHHGTVQSAFYNTLYSAFGLEKVKTCCAGKFRWKKATGCRRGSCTDGCHPAAVDIRIRELDISR